MEEIDIGLYWGILLLHVHSTILSYLNLKKKTGSNFVPNDIHLTFYPNVVFTP